MELRNEPPALRARERTAKASASRRVAVALATALVAVALVATFGLPQLRRTLVERVTTMCADAETASACGRLEAAIETCSVALAEIESPSALQWDDDRDAEDELRVRLLRCRGVARKRLANFDGALADFGAAQRLRPGRAELAIDVADVQLSRHDFAGAIREYTAVLEVDPRSARALCNRGAAKRFAGDVDGAVDDLDKSIALDANLAHAHFNLGECHAARGDYAAAEREFDASVAADDTNADCRSSRGALRLKCRRNADAARDFDRAIELAPDRTHYLVLRATANLELDRAAARADLVSAIRRAPDDAFARNVMAILDEREGRHAEALAGYGEAIRLDPGGARYWRNRADLRLKRGDVPGATSDARQAVALDPRDEKSLAVLRRVESATDAADAR